MHFPPYYVYCSPASPPCRGVMGKGRRTADSRARQTRGRETGTRRRYCSCGGGWVGILAGRATLPGLAVDLSRDCSDNPGEVVDKHGQRVDGLSVSRPQDNGTGGPGRRWASGIPIALIYGGTRKRPSTASKTTLDAKSSRKGSASRRRKRPSNRSWKAKKFPDPLARLSLSVIRPPS